MLIGLRSRRQIAPFTLHRPATVTEALTLRQQPGSAFMAGGMDLIDWLKYGHKIEHVIRLDGIPGLAGIAEQAGILRIGATPPVRCRPIRCGQPAAEATPWG